MRRPTQAAPRPVSFACQERAGKEGLKGDVKIAASRTYRSVTGQGVCWLTSLGMRDRVPVFVILEQRCGAELTWSPGPALRCRDPIA